MSGLRFEDILINVEIDEFDRVTGNVEFPYFHKQIEVTCDEGVTAEYVAHSIRWLAEVDEALVRIKSPLLKEMRRRSEVWAIVMITDREWMSKRFFSELICLWVCDIL